MYGQGKYPIFLEAAGQGHCNRQDGVQAKEGAGATELDQGELLVRRGSLPSIPMHFLTSRKIVVESSTALWVMDYGALEPLDTVDSSIGSVHFGALWTLLVRIVEADLLACVRTYVVRDRTSNIYRHCSSRQATPNQTIGWD